jgi:WD40 repeat protein
VKVWETASGRCLASWKAHGGRIRALRFDPDDRRLATSAMDGAVRLWDLATGTCLKSWSESNARTCDALDFSADGKRIAHSARDGEFVIEDVESAAALRRLPLPKTEAVAIRFMPDGRSLLVLNREENPRLWTPDGATISLPACDGSVWCCAVHPTGESVALGTWNQVIQIIDLRTHRATSRLAGHHGLIVAMEYRPGEPEIIASASGDGTVRLWDTAAAVCLATLEVFGDKPALSVDFSADGRLLLAAGDNGGIVLWDLAAGMRRIAGNLRYQVDRLRLGDGPREEGARAPAALTAELAPHVVSFPTSRAGGVAPATVSHWGSRGAQSSK